MANALCQNSIRWPAAFVSGNKPPVRHSESASPFGDVHGLPVFGKHDAIAFIMVLLFMCCPLAVTRLIIPVIVYSMDRVTVIVSRPHIITKSDKRFSPPVANYNAPAAIMFIASGVCVATAVNHCAPEMIEGCVTLAMNNVSPVSFSGYLRFQASTRLCGTLSKASMKHLRCLAAIAIANIKSVDALTQSRDYYQAAKPFSSQVFNSHLVVSNLQCSLHYSIIHWDCQVLREVYHRINLCRSEF